MLAVISICLYNLIISGIHLLLILMARDTGFFYIIEQPWRTAPLLFVMLAMICAASLWNKPVLWVLSALLSMVHIVLFRLPGLLYALDFGGIPRPVAIVLRAISLPAPAFCLAAAITLLAAGQRGRVDEFYPETDVSARKKPTFQIGCASVFLLTLVACSLASAIYLSATSYTAHAATLDSSGWGYDSWQYAQFPANEESYSVLDDERFLAFRGPEEARTLSRLDELEGREIYVVAHSGMESIVYFYYYPNITPEELAAYREEEDIIGSIEMLDIKEGIDPQGYTYREQVYLHSDSSDEIPIASQYVRREYFIDGDVFTVELMLFTIRKDAMLAQAARDYLDRVILVPQGSAAGAR